MSGLKEHRIYSYMSQPFKFFGLTMDEFALGLLCLGLSYIFESMSLKVTFMILTPLSVYVIKRLKKLAIGFSLVSFAHWQLGIRFGLSNYTPRSWKRRLWG